MEIFEDGTSVLNIPYAIMDHCGTYICEAMNRNGIDTTATQLIVIPEGTFDIESLKSKYYFITRLFYISVIAGQIFFSKLLNICRLICQSYENIINNPIPLFSKT